MLIPYTQLHDIETGLEFGGLTIDDDIATLWLAQP